MPAIIQRRDIISLVTCEQPSAHVRHLSCCPLLWCVSACLLPEMGAFTLAVGLGDARLDVAPPFPMSVFLRDMAVNRDEHE